MSLEESFRAIGKAALAALREVPGVEYADCRVALEERRSVSLRNREVDDLTHTESSGVGVRVLRRGAWGFAALPGPTEAGAQLAARRAAELAGEVATVKRERVRLCEEAPATGRYLTPVEIDPFEVPLDRVLDDLAGGVAAMLGGPAPKAPIQSAQAHVNFRRKRTLFVNTEGSETYQNLVFGGAGIKVLALAEDGSAVQRSWPMDIDGGLSAAGYEVVGWLGLAQNGARLREECLALAQAPLCPAGRQTLVLDTPQLAIQIHESCGHPTEADRALGEEISLAGSSFLTPDRLGHYTYGSPLVHLTADAMSPGGLGSFGWDDEGVPARVTPLVEGGVFVGYLSSRETAAKLGLDRSAGCMRAESWSAPPIIRMVNVSLQPVDDGPRSLEELVADTDHGILMGQNQSWSIDDRRLDFQFGCEAAWEIRRGKITQMLRNPIYGGQTPAFWRGCDAIGGPQSFRMWGIASCGKGDPAQGMAVGHGCPPARFRDVEIGASRGGAR